MVPQVPLDGQAPHPTTVKATEAYLEHTGMVNEIFSSHFNDSVDGM